MLGDSVFVGYPRVDSEFAHRIAEDLKAAGVGVWIDENIGPGDRWREEIDRAIQNCTSMVVILSPNSVDSKEVGNEVNYALDLRKPVIPILYKKCEIPYFLRSLQHVDFRPDYRRALAVIFEKLGVAEKIGFQFQPNTALTEVSAGEPAKVTATSPADTPRFGDRGQAMSQKDEAGNGAADPEPDNQSTLGYDLAEDIVCAAAGVDPRNLARTLAHLALTASPFRAQSSTASGRQATLSR